MGYRSDRGFQVLSDMIIETQSEPAPSRGLGIDAEYLAALYDNYGNLPYSDLMRIIVIDVGRVVMDGRGQQEYNTATPAINLILDALRLIPPEIASFHTGVRILAEAIREVGFQAGVIPFTLGAMLDDVIHLRGTVGTPLDLNADYKGALILAANYIELVDSQELQEFEQGLNITLDELRRLTSDEPQN